MSLWTWVVVLGVWVFPKSVGNFFLRAWRHRLVKFELWDSQFIWVGIVLMGRTVVVGKHGHPFGWQHSQAYADVRGFREVSTAAWDRHSSWNLVSGRQRLQPSAKRRQPNTIGVLPGLDNHAGGDC